MANGSNGAASSVLAVRGWQVAAVVGLPLLAAAVAWGALDARVNSIVSVQAEHRERITAGEQFTHSIDKQLARILTILERMDKDLLDKVKAEVRAANGGK